MEAKVGSPAVMIQVSSLGLVARNLPYVCIHVYRCIYVCIHTDRQTDIHAYIHAYAYLYIDIRVYIYTRIYSSTLRYLRIWFVDPHGLAARPLMSGNIELF